MNSIANVSIPGDAEAPAGDSSAGPGVPIIYSRVAPPERLRARGRWLAFTIATLATSVLVTAALLKPSADGTGSHRALGLRECQFKARTGLPCPSCGYTTSFTYFARGNLLASLYIQPMGLVLALATAAAVWIGYYAAFTGRPVYRLLRLIPSRYYILPLMAWGVLAWVWKIVLTLRGLDGWK